MKHRFLGLALATIMAAAGLPAAATAAQAQTPGGAAYECIDASQARNVTVIWHSNSKVSVRTKNYVEPCAETRVIFSVYVMPDLWDGRGFNETAFPQQIYKTTSSVVLSPVAQEMELPSVIPCKNAQFDVYYAPHITRLMWPEAHGDQYISAQFQHFG